MTEPDLGLTDRILAQGKALARAIAAMTIEPSGWFEQVIAGSFLSAYKRRLRGIVDVVPA